MPATAAAPSSSAVPSQPVVISDRSAPRRYVTGLYVAIVENQPVNAPLGITASVRKNRGKKTTKHALTAAGLHRESP
jgi:hypothetical protein